MADQTNPIRAADIAETDGLLFAVQMDGKGGGEIVGWEHIRNWSATHGPLWVHVDAGSSHVRQWLEAESGLTQITIGALLDPAARPRVFAGKSGFVTILRGVNLNEGADPEDMVAMRLWSDGERVITLRHEYLRTPRIVLDELIEGHGPNSAASLYERLIGCLVDWIGTAIEEYEQRIESIENRIDDENTEALRHELSDLRQDTVFVRRYMAPQRQALERLVEMPPAWLADRQRLLLRESADQFERYLEELDEFRERALVVKDDIVNRMSERLNQNMYVVSIVAAIFLPLGFLTGLLGINVGGMPGVDSASAFWITCLALAIILVAEIALFKKLKWI